MTVRDLLANKIARGSLRIAAHVKAAEHGALRPGHGRPATARAGTHQLRNSGIPNLSSRSSQNCGRETSGPRRRPPTRTFRKTRRDRFFRTETSPVP